MSDNTSSSTLTEADVMAGINANMLRQAGQMEDQAAQLQRNAAVIRGAAAKVADLASAPLAGTTALTPAGIAGATSLGGAPITLTTPP